MWTRYGCPRKQNYKGHELEQRDQQECGVGVGAYGSITKLELEGGMSGIGSESFECLFGHTNDHGPLCQGLGSIPLASMPLQRDGAIDGNGERHVEGMGGAVDDAGRDETKEVGCSLPVWFRCDD